MTVGCRLQRGGYSRCTFASGWMAMDRGSVGLRKVCGNRLSEVHGVGTQTGGHGLTPRFRWDFMYILRTVSLSPDFSGFRRGLRWTQDAGAPVLMRQLFPNPSMVCRVIFSLWPSCKR